MWPQIAREQLGAGNAGFATSWELPGSWEPGSLLRKTASWEAILGIKTTGDLSRELMRQGVADGGANPLYASAMQVGGFYHGWWAKRAVFRLTP